MKALTVIAVAGLVSSAVTGAFIRSELTEAREEAAVALEAAERTQTVALAQRARADAALALADSLRQAASISELRAAAARGRFEALAAVAPEPCDDVVAAGAEAISALQTTVDTLKSSLSNARSAALGFRAAFDSTSATLNDLRAATANLSAAAVRSEKRSFRDRITPSFGFGVSAGIDPMGVPRVVLGPNLGWSF